MPRLSPLHNLNILARSQKGISVVQIIIIIALIVTGLNVYAYFNPGLELSRYSVLYFLRAYNDNNRKEDLNKIKVAVIKYYDEKGELPADIGWCSRIVSILHPDAKDALNPYFTSSGIPEDPSFRGTHQDYFYRREDRDTFILLARFENLPPDSEKYNYSGCFDWPGKDVYNYKIEVSL